ncbi:uncharacterized protein LOC116347281 [Contarinia nasturtii]|uniref:uncharacterized protein LOC116347281 n=1 Tax=Contarinia nasturtii TaxID=265458 RepID=UPI0012D46B57|nr:uncharacterized protein LOC116347281 [Contarinia nasturtii]
MKVFGVCVLICGIAASIAHPFNNQPTLRYRRQSASRQLHNNLVNQRLANFPSSSSPYSTQVINYPGGYSNYNGPQAFVTNRPTIIAPLVQHVRMMPNAPFVPQNPIDAPVPSQEYTYTTTTTTAAPIIVDEVAEEVKEEEQQEEEIATQAPVVPPRPKFRGHVNRRIQPTSVPQVQQPVHRFQQPSNQEFGQDFTAEKSLPVKPVARGPFIETEEQRLLREEQAKNAHYTFGTSIDDKINDHAISREETRDGLALRGMYSYSDGYFRRTIHYEADQNGYRVVKEEIEPIGDGPQYNPQGTADVSADLHDNHLSYSITADDFAKPKNKKKVATESPFDEEEEEE